MVKYLNILTKFPRKQKNSKDKDVSIVKTELSNVPFYLYINLEKLFQNIDYLIGKCKGYSIFNASNQVFEKFVEILKDDVKDDFIAIKLSECVINSVSQK